MIFGSLQNAGWIRERADVAAVVGGARRIEEGIQERLFPDARKVVGWESRWNFR